METLNEWLTSISDMLGKLNGAPGYVIVFLSCIGIGYVLRAIKRFPNDAIPVVISLWGGFFNMMIAPDAPLKLRIWVAFNLLFGVILGVAAWLIHKYGLSYIESKIPWFKKKDVEKMEHETQILEKKVEDAKAA